MILEDASTIAGITSIPGNSQAAFVGALLTAVGAAVTAGQTSATFTLSGDAQTDSSYQQQLNDRGYNVVNNGNGTITLQWATGTK